MPASTRRLLRLGTPVRLAALKKHLEALEPEDAEEAIVRHINGELVVEVPQAQLPGSAD